jgi:hypothetical protein
MSRNKQVFDAEPSGWDSQHPSAQRVHSSSSFDRSVNNEYGAPFMSGPGLRRGFYSVGVFHNAPSLQ